MGRNDVDFSKRRVLKFMQSSYLEMDGESHRARKGLFYWLEKFLPEDPVTPLVIFPLQYRDNFSPERPQPIIKKTLFLKHLVTARMGKQVHQLQTGHVVRLGLDLELLAGQDCVKFLRRYEFGAPPVSPRDSRSVALIETPGSRRMLAEVLPSGKNRQPALSSSLLILIRAVASLADIIHSSPK